MKFQSNLLKAIIGTRNEFLTIWRKLYARLYFFCYVIIDYIKCLIDERWRQIKIQLRKQHVNWTRVKYFCNIPRGGSRTVATSKVELFVIIVNGFQPLTITTSAPSFVIYRNYRKNYQPRFRTVYFRRRLCWVVGGQ